MSSRGDIKYNQANQLGKQSSLQIWRHIVQLVTFVALNGKFFGLASTTLIVPYLHPTQAPFSTVHGAYESLEYTISRGMFPLLALGVIYLTGITVGRLFCGWACPFGMVQDFLSYMPVKKYRVSAANAASIRDIKWTIVAFSIITSVLVGFRRVNSPDEFPVGVFSDSPFSVLSPSGTLFAYIPWMAMWNHNVLLEVGMVGWLKILGLTAIIAPSMFVPRFFCRYICPLGALLEPLSKFKCLRIKKSSQVSKEDANKMLADICPMGVEFTEESNYIDSGSCISCGKCITQPKSGMSQSIIF